MKRENHLIYIFIQIVNVFAITPPRVLNGDELRGGPGQFIDFANDRIFIINM